MTNTNTTDLKTWTVEEIAARRATGDKLVTVDNWACGTTTGHGIDGVRLGLYKSEPVTYRVYHRDERDGEVFPTSDDAECYALNRGALQWYSDARREDERLAAEVTDDQILALRRYAFMAAGPVVWNRGTNGPRYAVGWLLMVAEHALAGRYDWARAGAARAILDLGL